MSLPPKSRVFFGPAATPSPPNLPYTTLPSEASSSKSIAPSEFPAPAAPAGPSKSVRNRTHQQAYLARNNASATRERLERIKTLEAEVARLKAVKEEVQHLRERNVEAEREVLWERVRVLQERLGRMAGD